MSNSTPLITNAGYDIVETIPTRKIIQLYKEKVNIDVSKFFKGLENIEIRKCKSSHYKYYYPYNLEGDASFYDKLSDKDGYYLDRDWQYNQAQRIVQENEKVIDIGCGNGIFLESIKHLTSQIYGAEFNPNAIKQCQEKGIEVFSEDLTKLAQSHSNQFDVVTYFQVLEHVSDVKSFIGNSLKLLKTKGKLVIAVPNNNPFLFKYEKYHTLNLPPHHLGLWSVEAMSNLPNIFDIKTISIHTEPMLSFEHWFKVQLNHHLGFNPLPNLKIINRFLQHAGKSLASKIEGRNIVAIYEKTN